MAVLVGPSGPAVRAWRSWAEASGRPVAQAAAGDPPEIARRWVSEAFGSSDPAALAHNWLRAVAGTAGGPPPGPKTRYDLDRLWRSLPVDPASPSPAVVYQLLAAAIDGRPADPTRLVSEGSADRPGSPAGLPRVFAGVCGLLPGDRWPALLLLPAPAADPTARFAAAVRFLASLADAVPTLPVAVAVPADVYAAGVPAGRTDRTATLAREGAVAVPGVSAGELTARLLAAGVDPPPPPATIDRLTAGGLAAEVAAAADDFRSVHERFLFEQLECLPETAGLFRPNLGLPFAHGNRPAEADLVCERLKLVVEVDGAHYHLNQPQYRRDRRKDWLYQKHGYLVIRVLAEDVVDDLAVVLSAVQEAVALRRPV
ncbi:MAG: hypothetical protein JWO38_1138 [Gemmataceae bacterium]|nr:hypothetical protein [Gemmataceae bacterium]